MDCIRIKDCGRKPKLPKPLLSGYVKVFRKSAKAKVSTEAQRVIQKSWDRLQLNASRVKGKIRLSSTDTSLK